MDILQLVDDYIENLVQESDDEILARFEQARIDSQDEAD